MMKTSIMTEKIARRGRPIPSEYVADHLEQVLVRDVGLRAAVTLKAAGNLNEAQSWLRSGAPETAHHGFPVVDERGRVVGVLTQRDIFAAAPSVAALGVLVKRALVAIAPSATLREAADTMLHEGVGRLPVMEGEQLVGIVTRSDLLEGHRRRLDAAERVERARSFKASTDRRLHPQS